MTNEFDYFDHLEDFEGHPVEFVWRPSDDPYNY